MFITFKQRPAGPDFKLPSFLSVGTKQQSRLKYSHSLMSICLVPPGGTRGTRSYPCATAGRQAVRRQRPAERAAADPHRRGNDPAPRFAP